MERAPLIETADRAWLKARLLKVQGGCAVCGKTTRTARSDTWMFDWDRSCHPKGGECWDCVRGVVCNRCGCLLRRFVANRDALPHDPVNGLDPFEWGTRAVAHLERGGTNGSEPRTEEGEETGADQ